MALEYTSGAMAGNTKAIGLITKCMEMDSTNGKMDACMLGSINLIRSMALAPTHGLMDVSIPESGRIASVMAGARLSLWMELKGKEFGRRTEE